MATRTLIVLAMPWIIAAAIARADDFGPRQDVREVRADARTLLAHHLRVTHVAPESLLLSDVVVVGNQALFSWDAGKEHGLNGFSRIGARWWDALDKGGWGDSGCWDTDIGYPLKGSTWDQYAPDASELATFGISAPLIAASLIHNRDVRSAELNTQNVRREHMWVRHCKACFYTMRPWTIVDSHGGVLAPFPRSATAGYDLSIAYAKNNAALGTTFEQIYARRPTDAEMLPYPTPMNFSADAVFYFDLTLDGPKPVTFAPGTTIEVWCPFVLDGALHYNLTISAADKPIGPVYGTLFDNVMRFQLPGFTAFPGKALMAEIDGDLH